MTSARACTFGCRKGTRDLSICVMLLVALLATSSPTVLITSDPEPARIAAYASHEPIFISGNTNFTSANGVVSGIGSEADPYVISGWEIIPDPYTPDSTAIEVLNTDAHFVIRDLSVGRNYGYDTIVGISLVNVSNCLIDSVTVTLAQDGIQVAESDHLRMTGNHLTNAEVMISTSSNVSLTQNFCANGLVWLVSSVDVEVSNNTIYGSPSGWGYGSFGIFSYACSSCTIVRNTIGTGYSENWNDGIILSECIGFKVDRNTMAGQSGIDLRGYSPEQFSSHDVGQNNTVRGMFIHFFRNQNNVDLSDQSFGQLIVVNCTQISLKRLTSFDARVPIILAYTDRGVVEGCTFYNNSEAIRMYGSSRLSLEDNTFWAYSSVWVSRCSSIGFIDNIFPEGSLGTLHLSETNGARIERNTFSYSCMEVYMAYCTNCTVTGNLFPHAGLRIEGDTVWQVASHDIDASNSVYSGTLRYVKNVTDLVIDEQYPGQLIVANCSRVTIRNFSAQFGYPLQLLSVDNSTIENCSFINALCPIVFFYANNVTVRGCMFQDTYRYFFDFHMAFDIRVFHNNFFGTTSGWTAGGYDYDPEGEITWDDGYPSGGNYWELGSHEDNYSGPSQNEPGSDGIVDSPYDMWDLGADRYPLAEPYGYVPPSGPSLFDQPEFYIGTIAAIVIISALLSYALYVKAGKKLAGGTKQEEGPPPGSDEK